MRERIVVTTVLGCLLATTALGEETRIHKSGEPLLQNDLDRITFKNEVPPLATNKNRLARNNTADSQEPSKKEKTLLGKFKVNGI